MKRHHWLRRELASRRINRLEIIRAVSRRIGRYYSRHPEHAPWNS